MEGKGVGQDRRASIANWLIRRRSLTLSLSLALSLFPSLSLSLPLSLTHTHAHKRGGARLKGVDRKLGDPLRVVPLYAQQAL